MRALSLTALLVGWGFAGCATKGTNFQTDSSWIKSDTTTTADVTYMYGEPYFVGESQGRETWTYGYYRWRLLGDSYTKELKIYWNRDKTVRGYSFTSNFPDDKRAIALKNKYDNEALFGH